MLHYNIIPLNVLFYHLNHLIAAHPRIKQQRDNGLTPRICQQHINKNTLFPAKYREKGASQRFSVVVLNRECPYLNTPDLILPSQALLSVRTRLAVLSEVLNGTDHLRGVGVLVVVPRHDLNLIGVVAATLNFRTFPSSSSQFCNNSYSTRSYRCRTKTGLFVPQLYHVSASFAKI